MQRPIPEPFSLACTWERPAAERIGVRLRVTTPDAELKPAYLATFQRLSDYLVARGDLAPEEYFGLLLNRFVGKVRRVPRFSTKLLGTEFYNRIVDEQRGERRARFAGREDTETRATTIRAETSGFDFEQLAVESARFALLQHQYPWLHWGRFWMFFGAEFSGAFLYATPEYRIRGPIGIDGKNPELHLVPRQRREWDVLEKSPRLARSVKDMVIRYRSILKERGWLTKKTDICRPLPTVADLAKQLLDQDAELTRLETHSTG